MIDVDHVDEHTRPVIHIYAYMYLYTYVHISLLDSLAGRTYMKGTARKLLRLLLEYKV